MKRLILGVAAALLLSAGQAAADGLPTRGNGKAADDDGRPCAVAAETGFSSERAIRGMSESAESFSVLGEVELTCGRFYAGVAGSSVKVLDASALAELSAGFRPKTGPITWDFGVTYHAYNENSGILNFVEFKAAASAEIWRGGTLGGSVLYAPEYGGLAGVVLNATNSETWTFEGTFDQKLPRVGIFTPIISVALGSVEAGGNAGDYVYWNAGLTLEFRENWSLDVRYSDTDVSGGCGGLCDERVAVTLKYGF